MPFLSKDWRSPGEKWVRYGSGWEKKKTVFTTQHNNHIIHSNNSNDNLSGDDSGCEVDPEIGSWGSNHSFTLDDDDGFKKMVKRRFATLPCPCPKRSSPVAVQSLPTKTGLRFQLFNKTLALKEPHLLYQPFFPITLKNTKEIAGFNALADALLRLDFITAVRDIRRFDYVSKIMYTLFSHDKLSQLPGAAQKVLFRILEEMADTVYKNNYNEHVLRRILDELHATMSIYHVFGSHLGSANLFKQHAESRRKITEMVEKMQVRLLSGWVNGYL